MIALRNRIVGTSMLNACMEESRRTGFKRTLSELLLEKGVITRTIDQAIGERRQEAVAKLNKTEDDLIKAVDLAHDDAPTAERKLAVLFGEAVATKLMFLTREELEECLEVEERVRTGLPAEEPPRAARHRKGRRPTRAPAMAIAVPDATSGGRWSTARTSRSRATPAPRAARRRRHGRRPQGEEEGYGRGRRAQIRSPSSPRTRSSCSASTARRSRSRRSTTPS